MKVFIHSVALILVLGYTSLFSQANSNYDGAKPEVYAGAKSFVFYYTPFQSNFEPVYVATVSIPDEAFTSMSLYGAGFRYFVTNQIALGFGVNFGTTSTDQDIEGVGTLNQSATTLGIGIDANYHLKSLYGISPYLGINANFGTYSASDDEIDEGNEIVTTDFSGSGFGAAVQFGFDWFFTEGISLGGKYALGFRSLGKSKIDLPTGDTVEGPSTTQFGISTFSVILNVHI
jgi:outer membrane protein W